MKFSSFALSLTIFLVHVFIPRSAFAQDSDTEEAVRLAYEGKERFEAGDFGTALERFQKAAQKADSPVFDLYVARSLKALGRWVDAGAAYDAAARHRIDPDNESFVAAQNSARSEREALDEALPRLHVSAPLLDEGQAEHPKVQLDGQALRWPVENLAVDPGHHLLTAHYEEETFSEELSFAPSQSVFQSLPFAQRPQAPVVDDTTANRSGALKTATWISFGVAGAAGLTLAVTGTMTLVAGKEWRGYCSKDVGRCDDQGEPTDPDKAEELNNRKTIARVADVALITAGVAGLAGITFLIVQATKKPRAASSGSLELRAAGSQLLLSGRF